MTTVRSTFNAGENNLGFRVTPAPGRRSALRIRPSDAPRVTVLRSGVGLGQFSDDEMNRIQSAYGALKQLAQDAQGLGGRIVAANLTLRCFKVKVDEGTQNERIQHVAFNSLDMPEAAVEEQVRSVKETIEASKEKNQYDNFGLQYMPGSQIPKDAQALMLPSDVRSICGHRFGESLIGKKGSSKKLSPRVRTFIRDRMGLGNSGIILNDGDRVKEAFVAPRNSIKARMTELRNEAKRCRERDDIEGAESKERDINAYTQLLEMCKEETLDMLAIAEAYRQKQRERPPASKEERETNAAFAAAERFHRMITPRKSFFSSSHAHARRLVENRAIGKAIGAAIAHQSMESLAAFTEKYGMAETTLLPRLIDQFNIAERGRNEGFPNDELTREVLLRFLLQSSSVSEGEQGNILPEPQASQQ